VTGRVRVLVADDEAEVRAALVDLLRTCCTIDVVGVAASTDEAVTLAALHQPDVVVMDVKMPGGGGAAATRTIRQGHPQTQIVALSAYQDRATVLEMLDAGAVAYITKGAPAAEITAAVQRAADGHPLLSADASAELHELGARLRDEEAEAPRASSTPRTSWP
jgi:DNA-binding NarL/FixJ family response regulator